MTSVAKFRLDNEIRGGRYWMDGDKKKCKVCGWGQEAWGHVLEQCSRNVKEGEARRMEEILDECGEGAAWMKKVEERRKGCGPR